MAQKKHLFVCGCPRSGTTALWRLLVSHPAIVLGVERYVLFSFKAAPLVPALFQRKAFFNLQPGETFYPDLDQFSPYYRQARKSYDKAQWVGDKSPPFYLKYDSIEENFPEAHVIFIYRNIFDVAASYQKRALNPDDKTWSADRDYRRAVGDWNDSLARTERFRDRPGRKTAIDFIAYEDLFVRDADIGLIFSRLGLDTPESAHERYRDLTRRSRRLEAARAGILDAEQREHLALKSSFWLYRGIAADRLPIAGAGSSQIVRATP